MLLVLGMGTVAVFLTVLVLVITAMSSLVMKYAPTQPSTLTAPGAAPESFIDEAQRQRLLAVISAAMHAHRARRHRVNKSGEK